MTGRETCHHCGGPLAPRYDPRGRKARYCSNACRAAANRKRRAQQHQAELEQARNQTSRTLRTPAEKAADAAAVVRALTRDLRQGREFAVTEQHRELVAAVNELAAFLDAAVASERAGTPPHAGGNRAQRRAARRRR